MRIAVFGAGAWGTALASVLAGRHDVVLCGRDAPRCALLERERENRRYLPGITLPRSLRICADLPFAAAHAGSDGLLVLATPVAGLAATLAALSESFRAGGALPNPAAATPMAWLCKGFDHDSGRLPHEIVAAVLPAHAAGPLSGPSFADEVARGLPVALTVAGPASLRARVTAALHDGQVRVYSSDDVIGVEIGGAAKNVMAIATGIGDALALGANARAALITRGLAEISRLGVAMGARQQTFMGLTGLGDLLLTCTGDLSRNRRIGLLLGGGMSLADALSRIGHVAEGVSTAAALAAAARRHGVDMPLTEAVCAVLEGRISPRAAVERLLARDPRAEER